MLEPSNDHGTMTKENSKAQLSTFDQPNRQNFYLTQDKICDQQQTQRDLNKLS